MKTTFKTLRDVEERYILSRSLFPRQFQSMSNDLFASTAIKIPLPRTRVRMKLDEGTSIGSLSTLLKLLKDDPPPSTHVDLYRGHSKKEYKIHPSLFRNGAPRKDESNLLRELISAHPREFTSDHSTFERLVRMQHYKMPTRLLDLSFNPLVGMYFSCCSNQDDSGHFIRIRVPKTSMKYYDSDTVSGIANLAHLTPEEREYFRSCKSDKEIYEDNAGLRLHHFIKAEKPYFLRQLKILDLRGIVPVKPILNNRRILAQQGAFLLFGLQSEIIVKYYRFMRIDRFKIFGKNKDSIMSELDRVNINESTMFPEIEYAASYLTKKITPVPGISVETG